MQYYDMSGLPISMEQWLDKFSDPKSVRVAYDELEDAAGDVMIVSTVFIGMGTTMFETAIWGTHQMLQIAQTSYTFDAAYAVHVELLNTFYLTYYMNKNQERHQRITDKYFGNKKNRDFSIDT